MSTMKERAEFVAKVVKHAAKGTEAERQKAARRMLSLGAAYRRLQEKECNEGTLAGYDADLEKRTADQLKECAETLGVGLKLGGDPRGFTVKVLFPLDADGRRPYNTWGGMEEGWGVPTS